MQPYTAVENDWLSHSVPLTESGHIDVLAVEAQARALRAKMIGDSFVRLARLWRSRARAAEVQRELDKAALGLSR